MAQCMAHHLSFENAKYQLLKERLLIEYPERMRRPFRIRWRESLTCTR